MSAALISRNGIQHKLCDDLESSIYVLLWIALTFSEVSHPAQASMFLKSVLDSQPCGQHGDYSKPHFLVARLFLAEVKFLNRPLLDKLIYQLACLLGVRYILSDEENLKRESANTIKKAAIASGDADLWKAYYDTPAYCYDQGLLKLESHDATLDLFRSALDNRSEWPDDPPKRQDFGVITAQPIVKSGWCTAFENLSETEIEHEMR